MKKSIIYITLSLAVLSSCSKVKNKAKNVINKSGEVVGLSSSEFVDGIASGIHKKYKCEFDFKDSTKFAGIETGKYEITKSQGAKDNIVSLYVIFNQSVSDSSQVKVFDKENLEYGRTKVFIEGRSGEARYLDIKFDNRVSIESISNFTFE